MTDLREKIGAAMMRGEAGRKLTREFTDEEILGFAAAALSLITEREKELVAAAREVLPEFPRDPVNGVRATFSQCERLRNALQLYGDPS